MNVHEYQAKQLLAQYGVPVPKGRVASTPDEAQQAAAEIGGSVAVKAEIHAGGRGKAGGIKIARTPDEARQAAAEILGRRLVTHQTGPEGQPVEKVWIEAGTDIDRELYLSIILDRASSRIVLMASEAGGMDIEEVAAKTPEQIVKVFVDPVTGLEPFHARQIAYGLNLPEDGVKQMVRLVASLYRLYCEQDCTQIEINPLAVGKAGEIVALDAKVNFDDNGLFRHPELRELRDTSQENPLDVEASRHSLNFIHLGGNIGCMVNGAGLAMATMDIIKLSGGQPANFLDVGGGATADQVTNAFRIILMDPQVRAILINIFGGITRCDVVASGIVQAARRVGLNLPLVVRLEGTNQEEGKRILAQSGLPITPADNFKDAAQKAVIAAGAGPGPA